MAQEKNKDQVDKEHKEAVDASRKVEFLHNVPLGVSVELGRTELNIKDLLQLQTGSVIELDKLAGEPLEFLINRRTVARGEVIVVNEKFGIRLTDIVGDDTNSPIANHPG